MTKNIVTNKYSSLIELIRASVSLSDGDKKKLIKFVPFMDKKDLAKLEKTLLKESQSATEINFEYENPETSCFCRES